MEEQNITVTDAEMVHIINQIKGLQNEDIKQIKELCCFLLRKKRPHNHMPGRPRIYLSAEEAKQHQILQMQEWRKKQKDIKTKIKN